MKDIKESEPKPTQDPPSDHSLRISHLFYHDEQPATKFSWNVGKVPTPNIEQLLLGNPCFPTIANERNKPHLKNIILSDLSLYLYSNLGTEWLFQSTSQKFLQAYSLLKEGLMHFAKAGINFFIMDQNKKLIQLEISDLQKVYNENENLFRNMVTYKTELMKQQLVEQGHNPQHFLILDFFPFDVMDPEKFKFAKEIFSFNLSSILSNIEFKKNPHKFLIDLFNRLKSSLPLDKFTQCKFETDATKPFPIATQDLLNELILDFLNQLNSLDLLHLRGIPLKNLKLNKKLKKISQLQIGDCGIEHLDLSNQNIETLVLYKTHPLQTIQLPVSLKNLKLEQITFSKSMDFRKLSSLDIVLIKQLNHNIIHCLPSSIKKLDVDFSYFTKAELKKIFPGLETININPNKNNVIAIGKKRFNPNQIDNQTLTLNASAQPITDILEKKEEKWLNFNCAQIRGVVIGETNYFIPINRKLPAFVESMTLLNSGNSAFVRTYFVPDNEAQALPLRTLHDHITQVKIPNECKVSYNTFKNQYEIVIPETLGNAPILVQYTLVDLRTLPPAIRQVYEQFASQSSSMHKGWMDDTNPLPSEQQEELESLFIAPSDIHTTAEFIQLSIKIALYKQDPTLENQKQAFDYLTRYVQNFKNAALSNAAFPETTWLKILKEGKGACRHRATVVYMMSRYLSVPCRIITNDVHAYVEVYSSTAKTWEAIQLGGHAADILASPFASISLSDSTETHTIKEEKKEVEPTPSPFQRFFSPKASQPYQNLTEICQTLCSKSRWVIKTPNATFGAGIYKSLREYLHSANINKDILYAQSVSDLFGFLKRVHYGAKTTIVPGRLRKMLEKGGVLVLDSQLLNGAEKGTFKSLFDTPPTLFGLPADKLSVLILDSDNSEACSAFFSRLELNRFEWPTNIEMPSFDPSSVIQKLPEQKTQTHNAIDLYQDSQNWSSQLLGHPEISSNKSISWKKQGLANGLTKKTGQLVTTAEPWNDADFKAFLTRLFIDKTFYSNEEFSLAENFQWFSTVTPESKLLRQPAKAVLPINAEEIFYLDQAHISSLSPRNMIQGESLAHNQGWLETIKTSKKPGFISQIESLTEDELRKVNDLLKPYATQIQWYDESNAAPIIPPTNKTAPHQLITVSDPEFYAQTTISDQSTVVIPIHKESSITDLLEKIALKKSIKPDEQKNIMNILDQDIFEHQLQPLANALLHGKKVALYGQMPEQIYSAIQTLFTKHPRLWLSDSRPVKVTGTLTVFTEPLTYPTTLANNHGCRSDISDEELWTKYHSEFKKEFKDSKLEQHLQQLQQFFTVAEQTGSKCHPPISIRISYMRIRVCLQLLRHPKISQNDNPIKALFQHGLKHYSEQQAYLNVIAKYLFGPQNLPAIRQQKLINYPNQSDFYWRRLNCLNAAALRKAINIDTDQDGDLSISITDHKPIDLRKYLSLMNLESPKAKTPGPKKIFNEIDIYLSITRCVTIEGCTGMGKHYLALDYVKHKNAVAYSGNDQQQIDRWLAANPVPAPILIVQNANLKQVGTLEFLRQTLSKTTTHQIIFTTNQQDTNSSNMHPLLQDTATVDIPKNYWTDEHLDQAIITPQLNAIASKTKLEIRNRCVDFILEAYHQIQDLLLHGSVSIRDLQNVIARWVYLVQQHPKLPITNLAYTAICFDWQHRFSTPEKTTQFFQKIHELAGLYNIPITPIIKSEFKASADFYPTPKQLQLIDNTINSIKLMLNSPHSKKGLLIEGASGFGKSELLRRSLQALGYSPWNPQQSTSNKVFRQFTVTDDLETDEKLLLEASKHNCPVIVDELNLNSGLAPLIKKLLSDPLKNPEFCIFATQNKVTDVGRKPLPQYLKDLFTVLLVEKHEDEELFLAAKARINDEADAAELLTAFKQKREESEKVYNDRIFFLGLENYLRERTEVAMDTSSDKNMNKRRRDAEEDCHGKKAKDAGFFGKSASSLATPKQALTSQQEPESGLTGQSASKFY